MDVAGSRIAAALLGGLAWHCGSSWSPAFISDEALTLPCSHVKIHAAAIATECSLGLIIELITRWSRSGKWPGAHFRESGLSLALITGKLLVVTCHLGLSTKPAVGAPPLITERTTNFSPRCRPDVPGQLNPRQPESWASDCSCPWWREGGNQDQPSG